MKKGNVIGKSEYEEWIYILNYEILSGSSRDTRELENARYYEKMLKQFN